jgi:hypothetical protein
LTNYTSTLELELADSWQKNCTNQTAASAINDYRMHLKISFNDIGIEMTIFGTGNGMYDEQSK